MVHGGEYVSGRKVSDRTSSPHSRGRNIASGDGVALRLAAVGSIVPWLPVVLGTAVPKAKLSRGVGEVSTMVAEMICRLAHIPSSLIRCSAAKGVKTVLRARAFMSTLLLRCQARGFADLLRKLSAFRCSADVAGAPDEGRHKAAVIGVCHGWDESKQMLREQPTQSGARAPRQQVGRDVLVQTSMVHAMCIEETATEVNAYNRAETFLVPALQLVKKDAATLLAALQMGAALPFGDLRSMTAISEQVSACVLTFWCDAAASNRRALKHICAQAEAFPKNILVDCAELCLLHQLHRVRISMVEAHSSVSLAYCLSKLARAGNVMGVVSDFICSEIDRRCARLVGEPPEDARARTKHAMDVLFHLDASHHMIQRRGKLAKTMLLKDIEAVLAMDNGDIRVGFTHHCWSAERAGPCCRDLAETKDRMKVAYLNFFVAHGLPVGTLSRWTHIGIIFTMLVSGFVLRDLFGRALAQGLQQHGEAVERLQKVDPASIGAGEADKQHEHHARVHKVQAWLSGKNTKLQVTILCFITQNFDSLTYFLMGGEREGDGESRAPRRPGTLPKCEEPIPLGELVTRVLRVQAGFAKLLLTWAADGAPHQALLDLMGFTPEDVSRDDSLRFVRRHCVGFSAGTYKRIEVRLRAFPLRLAVLLNDQVPPPERVAIAEEFLSMRSCCVGPFGARLQQLFPTVAELSSPCARATLSVWLRSLLWTTYACEREHASVRRLCHSAGQGRNFTLIARERLMESVRTVHIERTKCDPMQEAAPSLASGKRPHQLPPAGSAITDNPLETQGCEAPGVGAWHDAPRVHQHRPPPMVNQAVQQVAARRSDFGDGDSTSLQQAATGAAQGAEAASAPPMKRTKVSGGSAFQLFQNERLKSAKELAQPQDKTHKGALTKAALEAINQRIRQDWTALTPEERSLYTTRYASRLLERRANSQLVEQEAGSSLASSQPRAQSGGTHWGNGTQNFSVDPELVRQVLQVSKLPKDPEIFDPNQFVADAPTDPSLLGQDIQLDGCLWKPRNLCPSCEGFGDISRLSLVLSQATRSLGVSRARSCDVLFMLEGSKVRGGNADARERVFALLSAVSLSPAFQTYTLCKVADDGDVRKAEVAFPIDIELLTAASSLDQAYRVAAEPCLAHQSGEELASSLVCLAREWSLKVCQYDLLTAMRMRITSVEEVAKPFQSAEDRETTALMQAALGYAAQGEGGARNARRPRTAAASHARRGAGAAGSVGQRAPGVAHASPGFALEIGAELQGEWQEEGVLPESQLVGDAAAPHVDFELAELASGLLVAAVEGGPIEEAAEEADVDPSRLMPLPSADPAGSCPHAQEVADAVSAVVGEIDDLFVATGYVGHGGPSDNVENGPASSSSTGPVADATGAGVVEALVPNAEAAPAGLEDQAASPEDPLAMWRRTEDGYVFDEENRHMGRITMHGSNIFCKCNQHGGKCSIAKPQRKYTTRDMMVWLQKGKAVKIGEGVNAYLAVELHKAKF